MDASSFKLKRDDSGYGRVSRTILIDVLDMRFVAAMLVPKELNVFKQRTVIHEKHLTGNEMRV